MMSKKQEPALVEMEEEFDFDELSSMLDSGDDSEEMNYFLEHTISATHNEMDIALELTRLVHPQGSKEDAVLSTFERALATVREHSPMEEILQALA